MTLSEVGPDIGELTESHTGESRYARTEAECRCVDPASAHTHRSGHVTVLRHRPDLQPECGQSKNRNEGEEYANAEDDDVEAIIGERQRIIHDQLSAHPIGRRYRAVERRKDRTHGLLEDQADTKCRE